jgi:hypothetical protein
MEHEAFDMGGWSSSMALEILAIHLLNLWKSMIEVLAIHCIEYIIV